MPNGMLTQQDIEILNAKKFPFKPYVPRYAKSKDGERVDAWKLASRSDHFGFPECFKHVCGNGKIDVWAEGLYKHAHISKSFRLASLNGKYLFSTYAYNSSCSVFDTIGEVAGAIEACLRKELDDYRNKRASIDPMIKNEKRYIEQVFGEGFRIHKTGHRYYKVSFDGDKRFGIQVMVERDDDGGEPKLTVGLSGMLPVTKETVPLLTEFVKKGFLLKTIRGS